MPVEVRVPKTIRTDFIRTKVGDARAEKLWIELFGDQLMPKVKRESLEKTLAALKGEANGRGPKYVPAALAAYFAERKAARTRLVAWLQHQLAETAQVEAASNGHAKPTVVATRTRKKRRVAKAGR